jgi:hypothetical protein
MGLYSWQTSHYPIKFIHTCISLSFSIRLQRGKGVNSDLYYMAFPLTLSLEFCFYGSGQLGFSLCRTKWTALLIHRTGSHRLCRRTVHYHVRKSQSVVISLSRIKPIHKVTYYIQKINFCIIRPSTFKSPNHFFIHKSRLNETVNHRLRVVPLFLSPLFILSNNICEQQNLCSIELCNCFRISLSIYFVLDAINILLSTLFSKVWSQLSSFAPIKSNTWNCVLCLVSISTFPDMKYYNHRVGNQEMLQMQLEKFSKLRNYIRLDWCS